MSITPTKKPVDTERTSTAFPTIRVLILEEAPTGRNVVFLRIGGGVYQSWALGAIIVIIVTDRLNADEPVEVEPRLIPPCPTLQDVPIEPVKLPSRYFPPVLYAGLFLSRDLSACANLDLHCRTRKHAHAKVLDSALELLRGKQQ